MAIAFSTFAVGVGCVGMWFASVRVRRLNYDELVPPVLVENVKPANLAKLRNKPLEPRSIYDTSSGECAVEVEDLKKSNEKLSDSDIYARGRERDGFESLQGKTLPTNSIAVQIYAGGGIGKPRIFALQKINEEWTAWIISPNFDEKTKRFVQTKRFLKPENGWENLWSKLEKQRITTLPDASEVGDLEPIMDGESVYIEILQNNRFRNYAYRRPAQSCLDEARKVVEIGNILNSEFKIGLY